MNEIELFKKTLEDRFPGIEISIDGPFVDIRYLGRLVIAEYKEEQWGLSYTEPLFGEGPEEVLNPTDLALVRIIKHLSPNSWDVQNAFCPICSPKKQGGWTPHLAAKCTDPNHGYCWQCTECGNHRQDD